MALGSCFLGGSYSRGLLSSGKTMLMMPRVELNVEDVCKNSDLGPVEFNWWF